jgi:CheY-like chemotaxis protein
VDDNVDVADTLAVLLRSMGYDVRTAYSAETALAAARAFRPAVALLDIGLPDVDGYMLAARFQADPWLADTRLIALSGYGTERDRARSAEAGFAHHLTKPYRLDQLEAVLARDPPTAVAGVAPPRDLAVD